MTRIHSALPPALTAEVDAVLRDAGVDHVMHGADEPVAAGEAAASDDEALALIGPLYSRAVAETVEATAPAGLPLVAPWATWAGVTRDDEPGCDDDPADHRGTVIRMVARDTVVTARVAADLHEAARRAFVVAGEHDYGRQLDGQLRLAGLLRTDDADAADVVVLAGLKGEPEIARAAELEPLPLIAFDGVQGADLGDRDVSLALPTAPAPGDLWSGAVHARRAAELVVAALRSGARERAAMLAALRALGPFDAHGDPLDPPVWLWRVGANWALEPDRPL